MRGNPAKDTAPERLVRRALWRAGLRGYRLHPKGVPGRPDICYTRAKLAIFVHGCFWHACPTCPPRSPRSNTDFWRAKFDRNRARDARKEKELASAGWKVITLWEHQIRDDLAACVERIAASLRD